MIRILILEVMSWENTPKMALIIAESAKGENNLMDWKIKSGAAFWMVINVISSLDFRGLAVFIYQWCRGTAPILVIIARIIIELLELLENEGFRGFKFLVAILAKIRDEAIAWIRK